MQKNLQLKDRKCLSKTPQIGHIVQSIANAM